MKNKTLVIGASVKPERYAYKAIQKLVEKGHEVRALSLKEGEVAGVIFDTNQKPFSDIDTVTMYVGSKTQPSYYEYIQSVKPRRVIFNPGTENPEFYAQLEEKNIEVVEACTLVLLATDQYNN